MLVPDQFRETAPVGGPMIYELWDAVSGNIIGTFDTKQEALAVVGEALASRGADFVATMILGVVNAKGRPQRPEGAGLSVYGQLSRADRSRSCPASPGAAGRRCRIPQYRVTLRLDAANSTG